MPRFVVNNNGDDPEQLRVKFQRLFDATLELEHELKDISASALHGRNYQTLAFGTEARERDVTEAIAFARVIDELKTWAADGYVRSQPVTAKDL